MSDSTYCSNCGKQISITARFCRFCGTPIRNSRNATPNQISSSTSTRSPTKPASVTNTTLSEVTEKIPDEIIEMLYARKRKVQIKNELKKLLDEIDELTKKVEIGLINETESAESIQKIQTKISTLQKEQESLQTKPLDLEKYHEDEQQWEKRLEKLEEKNLAQAVSKEVYSSLREEYSTELSIARQKAATEDRKARRWLIDLQKEIRKLKTEIEQLNVRREIEGFNKDAVIVESSEISKSRERKAIAAEVLTEILRNL